jgi:hypothetical protein
LLAQTFGDFELIIADDASHDGTEEICRQFERQDNRIRYFRQAVNVGMPHNLNTAIQIASAQLIANLHDGDIYHPDLLKRWKASLDRNPDAAFVFNSYVCVDMNVAPVPIMSAGLPERFERFELIKYMLHPDRCFSSPVWGTVMGRIACYSQVGGFDPRFSFVSDVALWLRLNARYPVAYVDEPLIRLHQREEDRPAALVNWRLLQAIVEMYREAAAALHTEPARRSTALADLRRLQGRHWLMHLGSCFRHERWDLAEEGIAVFRREESALLRAAATAALPALHILRRSSFTRSALRRAGEVYQAVRYGRTGSRSRVS